MKWTAVAAAMLLAAAPAQAQSFFGTGGDAQVKYMGCDASYTSDLFFSFTVGGSTTHLFNCHGSTAGDQVDLGTIANGTEVVFSLAVQTTGYTFYTGDASRNPDGQVHVASSAVSDGIYTRAFGFEDTFGGGDHDFNDTNFEVSGLRDSTVTPEPSSIVLLASGLGFLGLGFRRRRA